MDGLEQELEGRLRVIRLNVQDPVGKALAGELGFRMTPTFVFFDAARGGSLARNRAARCGTGKERDPMIGELWK